MKKILLLSMYFLIFNLIFCFNNILLAQSGNKFLVTALPIGKNVTIPRSTIVLLPLNTNVIFAATDLPQSLKFSLVNNISLSKNPTSISLAIYDKNADRVRYINLNLQTSYLYHLISTDPISLVSSSTSSSTEHRVYIKVESNKPLSISR